MIATVTQNNGTEATIRRYSELNERRKELDRQSRQLQKEIKTLETAIGDAVDANDGLLEAGRYLVEWIDTTGRPSYKDICEKHIAPGVLTAEVAATPAKKRLCIVTE